MTQRKLKLKDKLPYHGVAVLENKDGFRTVVDLVEYGLDPVSNVRVVYTRTEDVMNGFPLDKTSDVTLDENSGTITFDSFGTKYTARALQDEDGLWMSTLGVPVPGEALETLYAKEVAAMFSPSEVGPGESLIALLDEGAGEVQELVYTSDAGMYVRSNRGWFRVPAEHDEFDNMVIVEVGPSFIEKFDDAEDAGKPLSREDAESAPTKVEKARTAAAAWAVEEDEQA